MCHILKHCCRLRSLVCHVSGICLAKAHIIICGGLARDFVLVTALMNLRAVSMLLFRVVAACSVSFPAAG